MMTVTPAADHYVPVQSTMHTRLLYLRLDGTWTEGEEAPSNRRELPFVPEGMQGYRYEDYVIRTEDGRVGTPFDPSGTMYFDATLENDRITTKGGQEFPARIGEVIITREGKRIPWNMV